MPSDASAGQLSTKLLRLHEQPQPPEAGGGRRWRKALALEESVTQFLFALPIILTNLCYYCIPMVSVMFAGRLGDLEFAGSTLANSWLTVTGLAFLVGLSGALETLCGHSYGSRAYKVLGLHLQAASMISIFFCVVISIVWWYTEHILVFLHQSPRVAKLAAVYVRYHIPGLFAYGLVQNIMRFLQTQSVITPMVLCSTVPLVAHFGIAYFLVHDTALSFEGAALAVSVSLWISAIMLVCYVSRSSKFEHTWEGLSTDSFRYLLMDFKLALASAVMFCLEDWAYELLVILAGLMPNPETSTSVIAMCVNTEAIVFMIMAGLSAAVSTRVSNELGSNNESGAKAAMATNLKIAILLVLPLLLSLAFGHDIWAGFFTHSSMITQTFSSMTPLLIGSIVFDSCQGVLSGVARGCGWQQLAVWINLGSFYFVGMPISFLLAFVSKLYTKGLWVGLVCGLSCQAIGLSILMRCGKWKAMELDRHKDNPVLV